MGGILHVFPRVRRQESVDLLFFRLIEETSGVGLQLRDQGRNQPAFPAVLLHLIQTELNEIFFQVLERQQRVW